MKRKASCATAVNQVDATRLSQVHPGQPLTV